MTNPCGGSTIIFGALTDMMDVEVMDPAGATTRSILAINSYSTTLCGDIVYSHSTFPFSSPKFDISAAGVISFYSDLVSDVTTLSPNPFTVTITATMEDYPSIFET